VTDQEPVVPGIDVTRPSVERNPALPPLVRDNRRFLCAAAGVKTGD
jgi:hypothetical protein